MIKIFKQFALFFVPLFILLMIGGMFIHYNKVVENSQKRADDVIKSVKILDGLMKHHFQMKLTNILLLKNNHITRRFQNNPNDIKNKGDLIKEFSRFATETVHYSQIRIIDNEGFEKIRVNWSAKDGVSVVPDHELQNKSGRYYFKAAHALDDNGIYISPLDLTIDNGQIVVPYHSVIRIGTPLFNNRGQKTGILMINFIGDEIVENFKEVKKLLSGNSYLLNSDGYWLIADNPELEWGFMFPGKKDHKFSSQFPEAWKEISSNASGQLVTNQATFTYSTIYPGQVGWYYNSEVKKSLDFNYSEMSERAYYWKIVNVDTANISRHNILLLAVDFIKTYYYIFLLHFAGSLILGFIYAKKKKVTKELVKLSRVVEQSPIPIAITDHKGIFEYVNPKFTEMTGYTFLEVIGESPRILKSGEHSAEFYKEMWDVIKSGNAWQGELCNRKKNGDVFWEYGHISPLIDSTGQITNYIAFKENITEKRKAELDLARLASFPEYNPNIVVETDRNLDVTYMNRTCKKVFPNLMEGVNKHPLLQNIHIGESFTNKLENEDFLKDEIRIDDLIIVRHIHYIQENKTIRIYAFDVTDRKNIELELLAAKQKSEQANQQKTTFLANMSHEIRTPMNAILGMTHLCLQTTLSEQQKDYLTKTYRSASALLGIINDILDFSKIEAGKLDMESAPFNLNEVLDNVSTMVSAKAKDKHLEFLIKVAPDLPRFLVGDPLRLGQVLINLANNAVKFTEKGKVTIFMNLIRRESNRVTIQFTVQDTGIGITQEQIDKLFQSFSQADTSMTRKYGGTGLGLAITKQLIQLMEGKIWVESDYGKGSSFIFTANFALQAKKDDEMLTFPSEIGNMHVLVVDDSETNRNVFQDMLEEFRFKVCTAASGKEAIGILKNSNHPIELVMMDWKMPGMDGTETVSKIRKLTSLKLQPKVILITAFGQDELVRITGDINMDGFLYKPATDIELYNSIMDVFGQEPRQISVLKTADNNRDILKPIYGAKILLVEDNEINQQIAKEILEQAGFTIRTAENGAIALQKVKEEKFDAVLMDIQMPVMDGYQTTQEIRKDENYRDLPIIALTADAMVEDREKVFKAGMNDCSYKPIDMNHLFSTLTKWIKPGNYKTVPQQNQPTIKLNTDVIIPEISGINTSSALIRMGGNKKLYYHLLNKFQQDYQGLPADINKALIEKNQKLAHQLVHTIKGVSGNLGALKLQSIAASLDTLIKQEKLDDAKIMLKSFDIELSIIFANLKDIVNINPLMNDDESGPEVDSENGLSNQLLELLKKIEVHIQKREPKPSKDIMAEINSYNWSTEYADLINQLHKFISRYRFDEAQQIVKTLMNMVINENKGTEDE